MPLPQLVPSGGKMFLSYMRPTGQLLQCTLTWVTLHFFGLMHGIQVAPQGPCVGDCLNYSHLSMMIKYLSRSFFNLRTFFQCSSCHFLRRQHLSYRFWRIGYSTKTETHNFQIFGFGQANQGVTQPRAFMTSCTHTCLPFNLANGYGRVDAP